MENHKTINMFPHQATDVKIEIMYNMVNDIGKRVEDVENKLLRTNLKKVFRLIQTAPRPNEECSRESDMEKWQAEIDFFLENKEVFLTDEKYRNKYIAIKGHNVIDSDDNEFVLAKRITRKFPKEVVLIEKVESDMPRAELSSPEVFL